MIAFPSNQRLPPRTTLGIKDEWSNRPADESENMESICIYEIADKREKLYHTKRNLETGGVELI